MTTTATTPTEPRIIAHFRPQAWEGDNAMDIDGEYDFDVTDLLLSWPLARILAISDHSYEADDVWQEHPVSTERPHNGPFEIEVFDSIAAYLTQIGILTSPYAPAFIALADNPAVTLPEALSAAEALNSL